MIIKPLIGQHTAQKEHPEGSMSFDRALFFTEQFEVKLALLDQFWAE